MELVSYTNTVYIWLYSLVGCVVCVSDIFYLLPSIMDFSFGYRFGEGGVFYKQAFTFFVTEFVSKEACLFNPLFLTAIVSATHLASCT